MCTDQVKELLHHPKCDPSHLACATCWQKIAKVAKAEPRCPYCRRDATTWMKSNEHFKSAQFRFETHKIKLNLVFADKTEVVEGTINLTEMNDEDLTPIFFMTEIFAMLSPEQRLKMLNCETLRNLLMESCTEISNKMQNS